MAKKIFVSFILDETGSMQVVKEQTISGFNEYVKTLGAEKNSKAIRFTLTKFNGAKTEIVCDAVKLKSVPELNSKNYMPNELTPLYDAVGATIRSLEKRVGKGKEQKVLVVILTDGYENCSKEFDRAGIFSLVEEKKRAGWTFVFLGADQDAYAAGTRIGVDRGNIMPYRKRETLIAFGGAARASSRYTRSGGVQTSNLFEDTDTSSE